mgnify:CR=1 FL=1
MRRAVRMRRDEEGSEDEADALFAKLQSADPEACKEDYYSEEDGWDLTGLRSDLGLTTE